MSRRLVYGGDGTRRPAGRTRRRTRRCGASAGTSARCCSKSGRAAAWHTYRLPKGSYTYDPAHGWFTEWPRIRDIGGGALLLNMHGTFFDFPVDVLSGRTRRNPSARHASSLHDRLLRMEWPRRPCRRRHLHPSESAGGEAAVEPAFRHARRSWGPTSARGAAGAASGSTTCQGRSAERSDSRRRLCGALPAPDDMASKAELTFSLEVDARGDGNWQEWKTARVPADGYLAVAVTEDVPGDWLRVKVDRESTVTAFLPSTDSARRRRRLHAAFREPRPRDRGRRVERRADSPGGLLSRSAVPRASGGRRRTERRRSLLRGQRTPAVHARRTRRRRSPSSTRRPSPRLTARSTRLRSSSSTPTAAAGVCRRVALAPSMRPAFAVCAKSCRSATSRISTGSSMRFPVRARRRCLTFCA